jgi:hypothetical protein
MDVLWYEDSLGLSPYSTAVAERHYAYERVHAIGITRPRHKLPTPLSVMKKASHESAVSALLWHLNNSGLTEEEFHQKFPNISPEDMQVINRYLEISDKGIVEVTSHSALLD